MADSLVTVVATSPVYYELGGERKTGEKFHMRATDVQRHVDAKLVVVLGGQTAEPGETVAESFGDSLATLRAKWPVSTEPAQYLKSFPNGPNATLALQILELEQEEKEAAEAAAASTGTSDGVPPISTSSINQE